MMLFNETHITQKKVSSDKKSKFEHLDGFLENKQHKGGRRPITAESDMLSSSIDLSISTNNQIKASRDTKYQNETDDSHFLSRSDIV